MLPLLVGPIGATLVLGLAYVCTLILITGLHPVTQLNRAIHAARAGFAAWRVRRAADKIARASDQERLDMDRVRLSREQRRLEKQLRKQGVDPLPVIEDGDGRNFSPVPPAPDEFAHLPPPTITDNTVLNPVAVSAKKKAQPVRTLRQPEIEGARRGRRCWRSRRRGHPFRQLPATRT